MSNPAYDPEPFPSLDASYIDMGDGDGSSEELLRTFVQHMPAAGAMMDSHFRYMTVSSRWRRDFGLVGEKLVGTSHFEWFAKEPGQWHSTFTRCLQGSIEEGSETPVQRREGALHWVRWEVRPWYTTEGDIGGVIIFTEDLTEQRQVEEALQVSQEVLTSILRSSLDGIMAFRSVREATNRIVDFEWILVNPRSEDMTGRSAADLIGRRLLVEMPGVEEDGLIDAYRNVVETGRPYEDILYYNRDGGETWFHVTATRLGDGVAVTFRDVTTQKRSERQIEQANRELQQRNRELQDFAYVASHDLQEPLRKIRAFADLLRDEFGEALPDDAAFYVERMQDAAHRMARLISDLLAYSRVVTHGRHFAPVDLNAIAEDVRSDLSLLIDDTGGTVHIGELPTIVGDETQLRQLVQNLIANALKFHRDDEPPVITIDARSLPQDADGEPEKWELTVTDNGIGFDEKYLDRIFSPFQRLHRREAYEGTGMGLAICRRIVERHQGHITATSSPGAGTTFIVTLPATHPDAE